MTSNFIPTESKQLFIGRDQDIDVVTKVINRQKMEWIIHIPGDGGIGKTRLLDQVLHLAEKRPHTLVTKSPIDFYKTSNHTEIGLLRELANQLGTSHFPQFIEEVGEYYGVGDRTTI